MASKVYHIRLDEGTVLSAYDYAAKFYPTQQRLSPAQAVALAMRQGMAGLREADMLPSYTKEDIANELRSRIPEPASSRPHGTSVPFGVGTPEAAEPPISGSSTAPEISEAELAAAREKLRAQIGEHVEKVTTPDISSAAFEPDPSEIPDVEFELDIDRIEIAPMQALERWAEELVTDEYLQRAVAGDDSKYTLAVRIAYPSLDPELWGTKHARSLIDRLYPHIKDEWAESA